jgi:hypothetical protein
VSHASFRTTAQDMPRRSLAKQCNRCWGEHRGAHPEWDSEDAERDPAGSRGDGGATKCMRSSEVQGHNIESAMEMQGQPRHLRSCPLDSSATPPAAHGCRNRPACQHIGLAAGTSPFGVSCLEPAACGCTLPTTAGHLTLGFEALIAQEMHFEDMGCHKG